MRRLVLLPAVVALAAAGCDGGSESAREEPAATTAPASTAPAQAPAATSPEQPPPATKGERLYTKAQLPRLALQPADAPSGMRYTKAESGPRTFLDVGLVLDGQLAEVRRLGLRAVHDVIFDSTSSDLRLATRLWLFRGAAGASSWLEKSKDDAVLFALEPVSAPRLADESWAARGNVAGNAVISHAFRAGNVVVVVTFSTQSLRLSEPDALAAARKAVARVGRG